MRRERDGAVRQETPQTSNDPSPAPVKTGLTPQRLSFLDTPAAGVSLKNIYLQTDLGPLDLLGSITGVGDIATFARTL